MPLPTTIKSDILVIGSGFAGSLMTLGLHQIGLNVCLVEKDKHPRFAIGESSTPIADMILRELSSRYDLPWLKEFSRYGSWQESHPEIVCGLKRGFSYYKHHPGQAFSTDNEHSNELLVAASSSNENSDTNWLRSDFDAFLVKKVKEYGTSYFDETEILSAERNDEWHFRAKRSGRPLSFRSSFFLDATGGAALLKKLLPVESSSEDFLTDSRALYSHFNGVKRWSNALKEADIPLDDYPYDPDHSALHHLSDKGWIWMLRFNDDRTSMGILLDRNQTDAQNSMSPEEEWNSRIAGLPSVKELMAYASPASEPGRIIRTGRLQRKLPKGFGTGWVALPHTVGFVDPLHSTGIAHTLSGVEKLLDLFSKEWSNRERLEEGLAKYEQSVFSELELVDRLVAGCYRSLRHFELFNIWSMLYFTAAVYYEQQRLKNMKPYHFLCAGNPEIVQIVENTYEELEKISSQKSIPREQIDRLRRRIKTRIKPYNIAGLLDLSKKNIYRHTAVEL